MGISITNCSSIISFIINFDMAADKVVRTSVICRRRENDSNYFGLKSHIEADIKSTFLIQAIEKKFKIPS
jgi:hypothetical protein